MPKNPSKVITIEATSDKPDSPKFSIKGTDGNWYSQFKQWEGEDKLVYSQFKTGNNGGPFKKGDTVLVSYTLGEYNGEVQYKLQSIFPSNGTPEPSKSSPGPNPSVSDRPESIPIPRNGYDVSTRNFEKEAYEKCCSIWAAALYQNFSAERDPVKFIKEGWFWNTFQAIKADGDKRFATGWDKAVKTFKTEKATVTARVLDESEEFPPIEAYDDPTNGVPNDFLGQDEDVGKDIPL